MAIKWKIVGTNDPGKEASQLSSGQRSWESPLMVRRADARLTLWEIMEAIDTGTEKSHFLFLFGPGNGAGFEIRRIEIAREFHAWIERVDTNQEGS